MPTTNDAEPKLSDRISDAMDHAKTAVDQTRQVVNQVKGAVDHTKHAVDQAKSRVTEFGNTAAEKFEGGRVAAASKLEGVADTLHRKADFLPGGQAVTDIANSAAEKLDATANYVRQSDFDSVVGDVETLVKRNPGTSLLIAAGLGFLIARAFTGNRHG